MFVSAKEIVLLLPFKVNVWSDCPSCCIVIVAFDIWSVVAKVFDPHLG